MRLTAAGYTDSGPRPTNQDCYFVDVGLGLFVVADGMGGHNAGEVASRMAVDAVVDFIRTSRLNPQMTWPFPFDPQRSMGANRVEAAIKMANIRVHDAGLGENPSQTGMGTTLVVLLIEGAQMVIGHAGDSRAYRMRDTGLEQMTVDDTWVNAMLGEGAAAAKDHPMRHVLTSGVGMRLDLVPTVAEERIEPSERWLITSDGVHGYVPPIGLARGLLAGGADEAARRIVHAALDGATSDNSTAVVVRIDP